jgi:hypothetical protein
MPGPDLSRAAWRKSSYSNGSGGSCVEIAAIPPNSTHPGRPTGTEIAAPGGQADGGARIVAIRDSKDRQGPVLVFSPADWQTFAGAVKAGQFDLG